MFVICCSPQRHYTTAAAKASTQRMVHRLLRLFHRPSRLPRDGAAANASVIVAPWRSAWEGDRGRSTRTVSSSRVRLGHPWKRAHACATSRPRADEP